MSPSALVINGDILSQLGCVVSDLATKPLRNIQRTCHKCTFLKLKAITPLAMALLILALSLISPRAAPAAGTWTETAPLTAARYNHTATRLADGRVLVAGGYAFKGPADPNNYPNSELYDPATWIWSPTGTPLDPPRQEHTATLLPNGQVLVTGGYNVNLAPYSYRANVDIFYPWSGIWTGTGQLTYPRSGHTATLLLNGKVLVVGGFDGTTALNTAELIDPAALPPWPWDYAPGCYEHTATRLADGRVLVVGGYESPGILKNNPRASLYNPATGAWSDASGYPGTITSIRAKHTATLLKDGRVLVAGGVGATSPWNSLASAELYDPATGFWSFTGSMKRDRFGHTATLLDDGRVLVAGGTSSTDGISASAELFDPATGSWSLTTPMPTARYYHTATLLADGRVLVAGGYNPTSGYLARAELYDPLNLVRNGSFETASVDPGTGLITLPAGSGDIAHWTVLGAGLDYNGGYWQPAEGRRSLDLNALDAGAIWQTIEVSQGARYLISFALAGNPDGGPAVKSLRVILGGKSQDFSFDTTGKSRTDMGWTTKSCTLAAVEGGGTNLIFQSLTSGAYGPAMDNVRVIKVPSVISPEILLLLD